MLDRQDRIEKTLDALLPAPERAPARLHAAMRYAVLVGANVSDRCSLTEPVNSPLPTRGAWIARPPQWK